MIEEMQTQNRGKTYLWSPVAPYQAQTRGSWSSTGITPGSQLPVHKGTGWALGAEHRDEGLEGRGHQIQSLHPSSVTNPVLSLACLAAFCPELPPSPTSAAWGMWAKPSERPSRRSRIWPLLSPWVGGSGTRVCPATATKATHSHSHPAPGALHFPGDVLFYLFIYLFLRFQYLYLGFDIS